MANLYAIVQNLYGGPENTLNCNILVTYYRDLENGSPQVKSGRMKNTCQNEMETYKWQKRLAT